MLALHRWGGIGQLRRTALSASIGLCRAPPPILYTRRSRPDELLVSNDETISVHEVRLALVRLEQQPVPGRGGTHAQSRPIVHAVPREIRRLPG